MNQYTIIFCQENAIETVMYQNLDEIFITAAPKVAKMTTLSATSDDYFVKMTTFLFKLMC